MVPAMGKCTITLDLLEEADVMVKKAEHAIRNANGEFVGDIKQGSFQLSTPIGSVKGDYTIERSQLLIEIQNKPLLLPCGRIEQTLRSYLEG